METLELLFCKNILKSLCFTKVENSISGIIFFLLALMDASRPIGIPRAIFAHPQLYLLSKEPAMSLSI